MSARTRRAGMIIAVVLGLWMVAPAVTAAAPGDSIPLPSDNAAAKVGIDSTRLDSLHDSGKASTVGATATEQPAGGGKTTESSESLTDLVLRKFGLPGLIVLLFFWAALKWKPLAESPVGRGVRWLVRWRPLSKIEGKQFTILVSRLKNDPGGEHEELILDAIRDFEGVGVCRLRRSVRVKDSDTEQGIAAGHERARAYLAITGGNVLIWGTVLALGERKVAKLYWTPAGDLEAEKTHERYEPTDDLSLPPVFWADLKDVLHLLVVTSGNLFIDQTGEFIADRLVPFIESVQKLLKAADPAHGWDPDSRARVSGILANSLSLLGEQSGLNGPMSKAVSLYRDVLEVYTRDRVPLQWAGTQNNLGNALSTLGERESGTAPLKEAVAAYRLALEEWTRDRVPLNWAMTQNNLGTVLSTLGERESGTARLEEAMVAYRAALEERTRDRVPLDWAATQHNLGNALRILGERESDTVRLEEALAAYRAALEERTRDRVPLDWAGTQNNLGAALVGLGERESGIARLEEGVSAFRAALEERTRDRVPLNWAMTQHNLGAALWALGERESDMVRQEEAVAAYRAALEERARDRVPLDWAMTQHNLGTALRLLGERESDSTRLKEAVAVFRAALKEYTRDRVPLDWAGTQNGLGNAFSALGERESGTARLEEAIAAYRAALEEWTRDRVPHNWAGTHLNIGNALRTIGERTDSIETMCEALGAHLAAWDVFVESAPHYASMAARGVERDLSLLKEKFPPDEVAACLKKHEELLKRFRESQPSESSDDES